MSVAPKIVQFSSMKQSIPSKRVSSVIVPSSGPNALGGSMFTINIPPTAYFDASRSFLAFDLSITKQNNQSVLVRDPVRGWPFLETGIGSGYRASSVLTPNTTVFNTLSHNHTTEAVGDLTEYVAAITSGSNFDEYDYSFASSTPYRAIVPCNVFLNTSLGGTASTTDKKSVAFMQYHRALPPRPDRLQNGIHSLFRRIIIRSQTGVPIEDIQEYNLLASIQRACLQDKEFMETVGRMEGYGTEHDLAAMFERACTTSANTAELGSIASGIASYIEDGVRVDVYSAGMTESKGKFAQPTVYGPKQGAVRFAMQPLMGILSTGQSLPLLFMGGITFEFHLENASVAFVRGKSTRSPISYGFGSGYGVAEYYDNTGVISSKIFSNSSTTHTITSGTSTSTAKTDLYGFPFPIYDDTKRTFSYELKNIEYHADMVNFSPEFDDSVALIIQESGLQIAYTTVTNHHNNIQLNAGSQTITIQDRATSLRAVFVVFRRAQNLYGEAAYDSATLENFHKDGIRDYQFRVGTRTVPNQPVRCSGLAIEAFERLHLCFNKIPETHFSKGDDSMLYGSLNLRLEDFSRQVVSKETENRLRLQHESYFDPLAGSRKDIDKDLKNNLIHYENLTRFLDHYYNLEGDRFPFSDPVINPKFRFIIAQSFNEHKNYKSGINTAATALPIELVLNIEEAPMTYTQSTYNSNGSYRYDAFVMSDRILEVRCGGALTVVY